MGFRRVDPCSGLARRAWFLPWLVAACVAGCGTTRMSDSARTATEQLLISNAVDRAINDMDFQALSGKDVYFDATFLRGVVDEGYIVSSLRQRLLSSGCILKPTREQATYVVEARAGAVGTNRHDVLLGVPSTNLPNLTGTVGMPSAIPEIPFAKSTEQKGVAKLAVFAYNQVTGQPVWQSGIVPVMATARDTWLLGTGPFQRGTIYDGTRFAGSRMLLPFQRDKTFPPNLTPTIPVTAEAYFEEPPAVATKPPERLPAVTATATPPAWSPSAAAAGSQPVFTSPNMATPTAGLGGVPPTGTSTVSGGSLGGLLIFGNNSLAPGDPKKR